MLHLLKSGKANETVRKEGRLVFVTARILVVYSARPPRSCEARRLTVHWSAGFSRCYQSHVVVITAGEPVGEVSVRLLAEVGVLRMSCLTTRDRYSDVR